MNTVKNNINNTPFIMLKNNCIFNYVIIAVFTIGIIFYVYELILDSQEEGEHSTAETIWIWGLLILMILGLITGMNCFVKK